MSHHRHHHPEHRVHDREDTLRVISRHHKRQENLAWFGVVVVAVILALVGLMLVTHDRPVTSPQQPPVAVTPDVPPQVNPDLPIHIFPIAPHHHRAHHHRHHHHVAPVEPSCDPPTIPGYDGDGIVVGILNPDCND